MPVRAFTNSDSYLDPRLGITTLPQIEGKDDIVSPVTCALPHLIEFSEVASYQLYEQLGEMY